jgi:predicted small secreted protein
MSNFKRHSFTSSIADGQQASHRVAHRVISAGLASLGVAAIALSSASLVACGTVEGAGEDVSYVGDQIDEASSDVQDD